MCKYCDGPKSIQVSGGGRYASADVRPSDTRLIVYDGVDRTLKIKIKYCPMCGKKLAENARGA